MVLLFVCLLVNATEELLGKIFERRELQFDRQVLRRVGY